jgi:hypothetical protein
MHYNPAGSGASYRYMMSIKITVPQPASLLSILEPQECLDS